MNSGSVALMPVCWMDLVTRSSKAGFHLECSYNRAMALRDFVTAAEKGCLQRGSSRSQREARCSVGHRFLAALA